MCEPFGGIEKMSKKMNVRTMTVTAMLIALGVVIPMYSFPIFPPIPGFFTATFASHVPIMLSLFLGPFSAICVTIGTTMGFFFRGLGPEVTLRAASHIIFAIVGALMVRRGSKIVWLVLVTMIFHAAMEAIVMYCFGVKLSRLQETMPQATLTTAVLLIPLLTCAHHLIDFAITLLIYKGVRPALENKR
jgi:niacin transporter